METPEVTPEGRAYWKEARRLLADEMVATIGRVPPIGLRQAAKRLIQSHGSGLYGRAYHSLFLSPLSELDARVKMFIKAEKWDVPHDEQLKDPRAIQYRGPRFNIVLASHLYPLYDAYYDRMCGEHGLCGCYSGIGLSTRDRAALIRRLFNRFPDPAAWCADYTRFDAHLGEDALRAEHGVYTTVLGKKKGLKWMLRMQLKLKGRGVWGTRYKRRGARVSGDLNTLGGNTIVNQLAFIAAVQVLGLVGCVVAVLTGDDAVILGSRRHVRRFAEGAPAIFREMGLVVEGEMAYNLEEIEFCSSKLVELDPGCWDSVRVFPKPLVCDLHTANVTASKKQRLVNSRASAICAALAYAGQPVYHALACYMLAHSEPLAGKVEEFSPADFLRQSDQDTARRLSQAVHRAPITAILEALGRGPTECARASFALAFGVSPSEQVLLEQRIVGGLGGTFGKGALSRSEVALVSRIRAVVPLGPF